MPAAPSSRPGRAAQCLRRGSIASRTVSFARSSARSKSSNAEVDWRLALAVAAAGFPALLGGGAAARRAAVARILTALFLLVDRRPGAAFGFLLPDSALFIAFLDMLG